MANKALDTCLFDKAARFAIDAHAGTERRGKGFPYIIHPFEAAEIVATITPDQELLAAAVLHDTVEDTDVTIEQIRAEFGDRIAELVNAESDQLVSGKSEEESWRERKQAAIERLENASYDAKIVAIGDKLSNMRAIQRDYAQMGDGLWKLFHAPGGKADHEWHYRGLAYALRDLCGTFAYQEFCELLDRVFGKPVPQMVEMSEWSESGDGYTAISYNHCGGRFMMKLYAPFMPKETSETELFLNRAVRDLGIHTPAATRLVTDGERYGVEFERISPKKSFSRAISEDPSTLEKYALEFAGEARKFHSIHCNTRVFSPVTGFFKNLIRSCNEFTDAEKEKMTAFVDSVPAADTCIHGDLHIGNIITNGSENWWIDLSDFRYGNPLFDLGMFYFVCHIGQYEISERIFHMDIASLRRVWEIFTVEYFDHRMTPAQIDEMMAPFGALYSLMLGMKDKFLPGMKEDIRKNLIERC